MTDALRRLLEQLRAARFAELTGARAAASIPISERLLNELIAASMPPSAPVRDVSVQLIPGNRLRARARLRRIDFLPPIALSLEIERQPEPPASPLVLRILSLPRLFSLAGAALAWTSALPPGVTLADERLYVDIWQLLEHQGYGEVLAYVQRLRIGTEEGRLTVDIGMGV